MPKQVDPARLQPGELLSLINGTELGAVTTYRRLKYIRDLGGRRFEKGGKIHLLKFLAFVLQAKHDPTLLQTRKRAGAASYGEQKETINAKQKAKRQAARDIGPLPKVQDEERRKRCRESLRLFCEEYFPETFALPWSADHYVVIERLEKAIRFGGLFAVAMPRGQGKTSLCRIAVMWAVLYGYQSFTLLIGAEAESAKESLEAIKTELETNERLAEDFPEACHPIRRLEGIANRASGQTLDGKRTRLAMTAETIQIATVEGSESSGSIIRVAGITGRIRGMNHKTADGKSLRPTLVLLDDPQTDDSAKSLAQNQHRLKLLRGAILGLAGPGEKIAAVMPCTVIQPGDMADTILDPEKNPQWNGVRTKLLTAFPTDDAMQLWQDYQKLRKTSFQEYGDQRLATQFYREHHAAMVDGAAVSWEERFEDDEVDAVQYAMNRYLDDPQSFYSEYQNDPLPERDATSDELTADIILGKLAGGRRFEVPVGTVSVVAMVDIQLSVLYYVVCAFDDTFGATVIDYGTFPGQPTRDFRLAAMQRTMRHVLADSGQTGGIEAQVRHALDRLIVALVEREWKDASGTVHPLSRLMVDANWSELTDTVYETIRSSNYTAILTPAHGRGVTASNLPMSLWKRKRGDKVGNHWRSPLPGKRAIRHCIYDTNYWKSFTRNRFLVPLGDVGALGIYGRTQDEHEHFSQQCASEYPVKTSANERTVEEWKKKPNQDNHLWDCLVGCHVCADIEGVRLPGLEVDGDKINAPRKRSWRERQQEKRAERMRGR